MFVIYSNIGLYSNGYYTEKDKAQTEVDRLNTFFEDNDYKDRHFYVLELIKV